MIETRNLTKEEFERLMIEAPESETKFLRELEKNTGQNAYEFLSLWAITKKGLLVDGRPIYIAAVVYSTSNRYIFWTVVNSNVKNKITLCKYARRELNIWIKQFGTIYATMERVNPENMKWVQWLGFKEVEQDEDTITYKLGE